MHELELNLAKQEFSKVQSQLANMETKLITELHRAFFI
jgi:hypothetical protein